jgi:acyl carrier protein
MSHSEKKPVASISCENLLALIVREVPALRIPIDPATDLFEAGLDSMGVMHLLLAIEAELGIRVGAERLTRENFRNAISITRMLAECAQHAVDQRSANG